MPEDNILSFENYHYQHPIPHIHIYADFDSIITKIDTVQPNSITSFTENIQQHKACGFAYIVVGPGGKSVKSPTVYRGLDAVNQFISNILEEEEEIALIHRHYIKHSISFEVFLILIHEK